MELNIVVLGLSITSSWGNGHATIFRGLIRELNKRGHNILFLERDAPWYTSHRDMPNPGFCEVQLYDSITELQERYTEVIRTADLVMVGSYVPDGVAVGEWVNYIAEGTTAFYDIDTPVTLAKLERQDHEYLHPKLIRKYDIYFSFTGGPTLELLEKQYGSPRAVPLYCSVDPELYFPEDKEIKWDLGYLGTYSDDRQPPLDLLMLEPARRWGNGKFVVAGPQYPDTIVWPENVEYIDHLPPAEHRAFYNAQRYTLNITRADMIKTGYAPSIRLFEAAACGIPIISDHWEGLESIFVLNSEILISRSPEETLDHLQNISEKERREIGERGRQKVLSHHTAAHRAQELEHAVLEYKKISSPT